MCGLTGLIDFKNKSSQYTLEKMTNALHHRGPDDSGFFFENSAKAQIGLGHRRLSILDLSSYGHQPMEFENLVMVYNGEVYNFLEIRTELESAGYTFESHSDTEVLLKALHHKGIEAVHQFNGMFAIALHNKATNKLLLIRDRAGVKPMYWYHHDDLILFASELKSFHEHPRFVKQLNMNAVALYLQYGYIPQPHTIFAHTYKLNSGHYLEIDLNSSAVQKRKYWDVVDCYHKPKLEITEVDAIDETEKLLQSACEYRMVADVPVGIFLSGGYDSSVVTALLQKNHSEKLKTFSIGFNEEKYNEAHHARQIAQYLGTDHTEYYCNPADALEILPQLPFIYDEPFGDSSAIPTILVSRLARQNVTVSLSADGGDEVFAGYSKHVDIMRTMTITKNTPKFARSLAENVLQNRFFQRAAEKAGIRNAASRMERLALMMEGDELKKLDIISHIFTCRELQILLKAPFNPEQTHFDDKPLNDCLSSILAVDYKTYLVDDILTKVDRATMSASLEGREPLLDYRLTELVASLPNNLKINQGLKKYLVKQIAHKHIPKEMLNRPKQGFELPIYEWFKDELKEYLLTYLDKTRLENAGIFNVAPVLAIRDRYLEGHQVYIKKLWLLLMFEMWRERWM